MSAALRLEHADPARLAECAGVFTGSLIGDRYFAEGDRLTRSLTAAAGRGELWCALEADGTIAGVMRVVPRGFCGLYHYLSLIGVAKSAQGRGVGRFMMDAFERMARESGCRRVSLMVSDFNLPAQEFYRAQGYWRLGTIPDAVKNGIAEHVMLKDLPAAEE